MTNDNKELLKNFLNKCSSVYMFDEASFDVYLVYKHNRADFERDFNRFNEASGIQFKCGLIAGEKLLYTIVEG